MTDHINHQDGGFHEDVRIFQSKLIQRRRALALIGGGALLAGAGSGLGSLLLPRQADAAGSCTADAAETSGPYPADGTNQSQGETSDILTEDGVVRRDIRRSFLDTRTMAHGVQVDLHLKVINTNGGCAVESGFAIYIWHCDRDGNYSLYTAPNESYLRGVQVSNQKGWVEFKTIFPGCYSGRWPHIHVEIFTSLAEATNGRNAVLTTQLAMPSDVCSTIYNNAKGYDSSLQNFQNVTLNGDNVFGDDTAAQLAVMTPAFNGYIHQGYRARATLGVPV